VLEPPLVARARALGEESGFPPQLSCIPEVGRLLHVLAAQRGRSRAAEIGSGCGVGSAWIVSAPPPGLPFFTVELDAERAARVRELFADDEDVHVLTGDWHDVLPPEAPFDFLFADGGKAKADLDLPALVAPGGTVVIDDLTPGYADPDPVRELWLGHPQFAAVELLTTPASAAIVAVRAL